MVIVVEPVVLNNFPVEDLALKSAYNRWNTFKSQAYYTQAEAVELAEAGFYYILNQQDDNLVRCIFCRLVVGNLRVNSCDDPIMTHRKFCMGCPFIQGYDVQNEPLIYFRRLVPVHTFMDSFESRKLSFSLHSKLFGNIDQLARSGFFHFKADVTLVNGSVIFNATPFKDTIKCWYCDVTICNLGKKNPDVDVHKTDCIHKC